MPDERTYYESLSPDLQREYLSEARYAYNHNRIKEPTLFPVGWLVRKPDSYINSIYKTVRNSQFNFVYKPNSEFYHAWQEWISKLERERV